MNSKIQKKRGFTLVESLVAIGIVLTAITGAFSVAFGGLSASLNAKSRVTAYFLAQESIEAVKNMRDRNNLERYVNNLDQDPESTYITEPTWLDGITTNGPCDEGNLCDWGIDLDLPAGGEFVSCDDNDDCTLRTDNDGVYTYESGRPSMFQRQITISEITQDEATITAIVSWEGATYNVVIKENIFNWSTPGNR